MFINKITGKYVIAQTFQSQVTVTLFRNGNHIWMNHESGEYDVTLALHGKSIAEIPEEKGQATNATMDLKYTVDNWGSGAEDAEMNIDSVTLTFPSKTRVDFKAVLKTRAGGGGGEFADNVFDFLYDEAYDKSGRGSIEDQT